MISLCTYLLKDTIHPPNFNAHFLHRVNYTGHPHDYIFGNVPNIEGLEFLHSLKRFVEDKILEGDQLNEKSSRMAPSAEKIFEFSAV